VILADSSVLIDVLRARRTAASDRLREVVRNESHWGVPLPCVLEVLQGARDEVEWSALRKFFESQQLVEARNARDAHVAAARIWFDARRRGLTIRSATDCLIAQIALDHDALLLHDDDDFERIAKVRPLKTLRR